MSGWGLDGQFDRIERTRIGWFRNGWVSVWVGVG